MTGNDTIIGFAFDKVMADTLQLFDAANNKGAKTIAMTDSVHSELNKNANVSLLVHNPSRYFFSPNVAALTLCNAIMHCAVEKDKPVSIKKLETYQKMAQKNGVYI